MKTIKNLTANELRKSILQLAIQGKLVKQDPNDEPASELVKKIYEEKKKLIEEGKIKKDKTESIIFKGDDNCYYEKIGNNDPIKLEDLPFDIPDNWMWIRLKNSSILNGGYAFKSDKFSKEGVRVIRISDFNENGILNKDIKRYPYSIELEQYKILEKDILLCMTGGTVGKSVYINSLNEDSYINQRVALIRIFKILSKYFYVYLVSPNTADIINKNKNSTNDNISMKLIEDFLIPLPPLEEQQRIVDKINSFEPLLEKYEKIEKELSKLEKEFPEKLKKSILQYAIEGKLVKQDPNDEPASVLLERIKQEKERLIKEGKIKRDKYESYIYQGDDKNYYEKICNTVNNIEIPFEIPNKWIWIKSHQIMKPVQYGYNGPGLSNGKFKLLRISDIQNGNVNWKTLPYCNISEQQVNIYQIQKNDIYIARTGGTIGKSFRLAVDMPNVVFAGYLIRFSFIEQRISKYINLFLNTPLYWNQVADKSAGTGQPNINGVSLSNLLVPIPSYNEQERILNKINYLFQKIDC